jgi:ABC-type phosphate transport system permease subunit
MRRLRSERSLSDSSPPWKEGEESVETLLFSAQVIGLIVIFGIPVGVMALIFVAVFDKKSVEENTRETQDVAATLAELDELFKRQSPS